MSELKEFLTRTPFFGGLPDETMNRLVKMLVERSYQAGAEVFREGEQGKSMYVVHSGELVANQSGGSGGRVRLMRFFEGDFFGEMTLIEMQPRPFTALVERDAKLWELTNLDLYQLYRQDVKGYVLVLQNINRELCRRLRRAGNRLTEGTRSGEQEPAPTRTRPRLDEIALSEQHERGRAGARAVGTEQDLALIDVGECRMAVRHRVAERAPGGEGHVDELRRHGEILDHADEASIGCAPGDHAHPRPLAQLRLREVIRLQIPVLRAGHLLARWQV